MEELLTARAIPPLSGRFSCETCQNEFLGVGATDVHAIVSVTCTGSGQAGHSAAGDAAEILILDTSASMQGEPILAVRKAAAAAIDQIPDGTWFAVLAGSDRPARAFPSPDADAAMVRMDPGTRVAARNAVSRLHADPFGALAIGSWLRAAARLFYTVPAARSRHAVLLVAGVNSEPPEAFQSAIRDAVGLFQCDCLGLGANWNVRELLEVSVALLGSVELVHTPDLLAADVVRLVRTAMGRGVPDASLRVWTPQGASLLFLRQVSPTVRDLTGRRLGFTTRTGAYPTGAWGEETRDYHLAIRLAASAIGTTRLAARVQLSVDSQILTEALVKAVWSDNDMLTTRIDPSVAHYTGQTELAEVIQEALTARAAAEQDRDSAALTPPPQDDGSA